MMRRTLNRRLITAALVLIVILTARDAARAQSLVIRDSALAVAIESGSALAGQNVAATPPKGCNRKRRALIGAIIGGAAAYPLAWFAYHRFANEAAADAGTTLAAITMGGSIAIGAFVGGTSCYQTL